MGEQTVFITLVLRPVAQDGREFTVLCGKINKNNKFSSVVYSNTKF